MGIKVNRRKRKSTIFDEMAKQREKYPSKEYCNVCWNEVHSDNECLRHILIKIADSLETIARTYDDIN